MEVIYVTMSASSESPTHASEFQHNWFVLKTLVGKDFKLKYRRSVLGVLWSVLNPLLMMIVLSAVFSYVFKFQIEHFPIYLILGNTLFQLMSDSTSSAMGSIVYSASLLKKIRIEKMVFPLESVMFALVNFAISLIAVVLVMLFFRIAPTVNALLLPLLLLYMMVFCSGLGLLLSSLAVFFRDIMHLWGVVITAWTYATPLFYPFEILAPWMQSLMQFNPMYQYVTYFRDIMLYGTTPTLQTNIVCLVMAAVTFVVGYVVFRKTESRFILHI
ncbi:ABC transporter permease [Adlercreutzia sp. ZJ473]|uniref:ABC transporter permease n=1 Tax=Adlercreutzia sp. ZJ473 TaxID=2722822 RepID=UPI00352FF688